MVIWHYQRMFLHSLKNDDKSGPKTYRMQITRSSRSAKRLHVVLAESVASQEVRQHAEGCTKN